MYLQAYIDAFLSDSNLDEEYKVCKNYKEGINYSFALTGGDSIIHWDFSDDAQYKENFTKIIVKQFCAKSFVIVDNDNGKNPERKDILKECLGERFFELRFPEIENLLDQSVIIKTVLDYTTVKKNVGNSKLPEISMEHLQSNKVGFIIDNILLPEYSDAKKFCASNGGLKSGEKYLFCQRAIKHITANNLSAYSIELVKRVLDFIKLQN
jgi:hypothetical protein